MLKAAAGQVRRNNTGEVVSSVSVMDFVRGNYSLDNFLELAGQTRLKCPQCGADEINGVCQGADKSILL